MLRTNVHTKINLLQALWRAWTLGEAPTSSTACYEQKTAECQAHKITSLQALWRAWTSDVAPTSSTACNEQNTAECQAHKNHFIAGLVEGMDIGCGTNLIYCLLGAAVYGWRMVGVDVTDVALEWAERHIERNPHLKDLLEVRQPAQVCACLLCVCACACMCVSLRVCACECIFDGKGLVEAQNDLNVWPAAC